MQRGRQILDVDGWQVKRIRHGVAVEKGGCGDGGYGGRTAVHREGKTYWYCEASTRGPAPCALSIEGLLPSASAPGPVRALPTRGTTLWVRPTAYPAVLYLSLIHISEP